MYVNDKLSTIDIGLIGFGSWARNAYVPALLDHSDVRVKAVAARTSATLDAAREVLGPQAQLYTDYRELLRQDDLAAVMIGLPRPLNTVAATEAALKGKHVWVEPPFEQGPDTDRLLDVATASDRVFHADLELRYLPVVDALLQLMSGGELGTPKLVRVELANDWGRSRAKSGRHIGATIAGLATWYLDLIDVFLPEAPVDITLEGDTRMATGTGTLGYENGITGEFEFDLAGGPDWELRLKVSGEAREAEADLFSGTYRHRRSGGPWSSGSADVARPTYGFVGMRESVAAFLSAVRGETVTRSGPETYSRLHRTLGEFGRLAKQR